MHSYTVFAVVNVVIVAFNLSTNIFPASDCNVIVNRCVTELGTFIIRKVVPFGGADGNFKLKEMLLVVLCINMFLGS